MKATEKLKMMEHPYKKLAEETTDSIVSGGQVELTEKPGLSTRLQNFAFYCTENQKDVADALLVMDLHTAANELRKLGK